MLRRIILILGLAVFCCSAAMAGETGAKNPQVLIETSMGNIKLELFAKEAPLSVKNFLDYANSGHYSGTVFHRVIPGFMIQGGDPTGTGRGNPGYRFADEFHPELRHSGPGVLSMANSGPDSNGCQFFITERATPHLDNKHSVFGTTVANVELVKKITNVPRGPGDRPNQNVVLQRVEVFRSPTVPTA